jgi:hypothetical protein
MALPNKTARLRPEDGDLSRIQDNLAGPIDSILSFLTAVFSYNSKLKTLMATVPVVLAKGVSGPLAATGPISGTTGAFSGGVTQGSRTSLGTYSVAVAAGATTNANIFPDLGMPYSGSIAAITTRINAAIPAGSLTARVLNETSALTTSTNTAEVGGFFSSTVFAPGAYPFNTGDVLIIQYTTTAAFAPAQNVYFSLWVYC